MSIFVNIASYADPELLPTILDCIENAKDPRGLHFGVCWQRHCGDNSLSTLSTRRNMRIDDVPAMESRGCCWARARSQALYNGEDYVLQIDSHHRFEPHWDKRLIEMMKQTGAEKPIITSYGAGYTAETGKNLASKPCYLKPNPFSPDGMLLFAGSHVKDSAVGTPQPARFFSAHFAFTHGQHCRDVPYDPELYFHGEEIAMGVRSWTHGYDLFHPRQIVLWHQYHREGRPKHWDEQAELKRSLDAISKARVRKLLGMEKNGHDLTGFGLGTVRTLGDYEMFAGVDFETRRLHQDCIDGIAPPTVLDDRWTSEKRVFMLWRSHIEIPADTTRVAYFVDDKDGKMLWHQDAGPEKDFKCDEVATFSSYREPARIIIWPHTATGPSRVKYSLAIKPKEYYTTL